MKVSIRERMYNGIYRIGSVFEESVDFNLGSSKEITFKYARGFCIKETGKKEAIFSLNLPICLENSELSRLNDIISIIKSEDSYTYSESHYVKDGFDPKYFDYVSVIIDGKEYEMKNDDKLLSELSSLTRFEECRGYIVASASQILYNKLFDQKQTSEELLSDIVSSAGDIGIKNEDELKKYLEKNIKSEIIKTEFPF